MVLPTIARNRSSSRSWVSRLQLLSFRRNANSLIYALTMLHGPLVVGAREASLGTAHTDLIPFVCTMPLTYSLALWLTVWCL